MINYGGNQQTRLALVLCAKLLLFISKSKFFVSNSCASHKNLVYLQLVSGRNRKLRKTVWCSFALSNQIRQICNQAEKGKRKHDAASVV